MPKLIILDRDGVINYDCADYIKSADEWEALPGSLEAITRLNSAGYKVVIATNQSGIGRGYFTIDALAEMNAKMRSLFVCPHKPEDACHCRKPAPGMFEEIKRRYSIDQATGIYAIGDSLRDLQAAETAGFKPWLVLTGNGNKTRKDPAFNPDTPVSDNLAVAVETILGSQHG